VPHRIPHRLFEPIHPAVAAAVLVRRTADAPRDLLEPRATHETVRGLLAQLDTGLVERVDVVQLARDRRGHLKEVEELPEGGGVHPR